MFIILLKKFPGKIITQISKINYTIKFLLNLKLVNIKLFLNLQKFSLDTYLNFTISNRLFINTSVDLDVLQGVVSRDENLLLGMSIQSGLELIAGAESPRAVLGSFEGALPLVDRAEHFGFAIADFIYVQLELREVLADDFADFFEVFDHFASGVLMVN